MADKNYLKPPAVSGLNFSYDPDSDVLTVEGVQYGGELFRFLMDAPVDTVFKIIRRENGVVVVSRAVDKELSTAFDRYWDGMYS